MSNPSSSGFLPEGSRFPGRCSRLHNWRLRCAWRDFLSVPRLASLGFLVVGVMSGGLAAQRDSREEDSSPFVWEDKFRQLEEILPTPNDERTASGAPGPGYWQQKVDYTINVSLDEENHTVSGLERIVYHNRSPHTLRYLWLQLDANVYAPDSDSSLTRSAPSFDRFTYRSLQRLVARRDFDGSSKILSVRDGSGRDLPYTLVKTMLRVDLPSPLSAGETFDFRVEWSYRVNNSKEVRGRTGYEWFEDDGNALYEIAQWFPRLAAYTDVNGWQHKQFLGSGEFTLELGDYEVRIDVPEDHVVAATGVLQNPSEVLSPEEQQRLIEARTASAPVFIVTPAEALENEKTPAEGRATWHFRAENVRDFAFASSRKFIWDAQGHEVGDQTVMAMSYFPKEGEPLWSRYSTQSIIHTLDVYSRYTFEYPYPVAISVNGPVGGMEYPMICFNGPRPEKDGTYSSRSKYGLISVIIHEVGHNYFPMIVNSDERQWTWMDEGINTFLQCLTEREWEEDYPSRRGEPKSIVPYMKSERQVPIMTNSESLLQFGNNAYAKPATALNVLRETVLGRELFDFAFAEYARRWQFKRPMPADFFRTMEDASGIDLDWFWRGWFYTTDHTDLAITGVRVFELDTQDPEVEKKRKREEREEQPVTLSVARNKDLVKRADLFPILKDFYNTYDELDVTPKDRREYEKLLDGLKEGELDLHSLESHFTVVDLENLGGLVMPVILEIHYVDGVQEELRIPAEVWRRNPRKVSKLLMTEKEIERLVLDPHLETADVDLSNNHYPPRPEKSRFKLFKDRERGKNPMQRAREEEQRQKEKEGKEKEKEKREREGKNREGEIGADGEKATPAEDTDPAPDAPKKKSSGS